MKRFFIIILLVAMCLSLNIAASSEKTSEENQITKIGNFIIRQTKSVEKYYSR